MKVLVTGGGGYIGSVLCWHLLDAGHEVTVVDNLMYNQSPLFDLCYMPNFNKPIIGNVCDDSVMIDALEGQDFILPLAAMVGMPLCDRNYIQAWQVNHDSIQLVNSMRDPKQKIIFPTTNSGYGTTTGELHCDEETPLHPISIYGQTKSTAEKALLASENTLTLRLATVFGMSPKMRKDLLVNDFVWQAMVNKSLMIYEKEFKRNYVHIRDVAECFCHCIDHFDEMKGKAYNVGLDSANLSKEELALLIQKHIPYELRFGQGQDKDKRNYIVSNERLKKAGFEAKRTIEDGIQELIKGYTIMMNLKDPFRNA